MNEEITIDEWEGSIINAVAAFVEFYKESAKEDPENWPSLMSCGEWDEQFICKFLR